MESLTRQATTVFSEKRNTIPLPIRFMQGTQE